VIAAQILICPMLDHRNATTSGATNTAGREPQAGTTEASGEADHPGRDQSSASAVIAQLKSAGAPVDSVQELTVENDPNELLGRPGQYVGKALFHDSRLPSPKDSLHPDLLDTDVGGSVEIFASPEDAERRARYVRAFTEGSGVFAEYNYLRDTIFVRVTKKLTPDQAAIYDRALGSL
jgi:hypothetical protein